MSRFEEDTRVEVVDRPSDQGTQLRAVLQPRWEVWGPLGGYVAAIALRALARASVFPRPVSCHVVFLSPAQFAPVELLVRSLRRGRNSEALLVEMTQAGTPVLAATGWMGQEGLAGFEHADGAMPAVPAHETLPSFREHLGDAMDDWYPIWQHLEGKPERFAEGMDPEQPAAPLWRCWMSLGEPLGTEDPGACRGCLRDLGGTPGCILEAGATREVPQDTKSTKFEILFRGLSDALASP